MSPAEVLALAAELLTQALRLTQWVQQSHAEGRNGELLPQQKAQLRTELDFAIEKLAGKVG